MRSIMLSAFVFALWPGAAVAQDAGVDSVDGLVGMTSPFPVDGALEQILQQREGVWGDIVTVDPEDGTVVEIIGGRPFPYDFGAPDGGQPVIRAGEPSIFLEPLWNSRAPIEPAG